MKDETKEALRQVIRFAKEERACSCGGAADCSRDSQLKDQALHRESCPVPAVAKAMDAEEIPYDDID